MESWKRRYTRDIDVGERRRPRGLADIFRQIKQNGFIGGTISWYTEADVDDPGTSRYEGRSGGRRRATSEEELGEIRSTKPGPGKNNRD